MTVPANAASARTNRTGLFRENRVSAPAHLRAVGIQDRRSCAWSGRSRDHAPLGNIGPELVVSCLVVCGRVCHPRRLRFTIRRLKLVARAGPTTTWDS